MPYISGDAFKSICHHCFDDHFTVDPDLVNDKDLIFVATHLLPGFISKIHSKIKNSYVLITHNSDASAPGKHVDILNDSKIIAWFTQNFDGTKHEKIFPIPIGIANLEWEHGNKFIIDLVKEKLIHKKTEKPKRLIYANFSIQTNPEERSYCENTIKRLNKVYMSKPCSFKKYLNELINTKFVVSPRGNGLDCHRTWEALLMGAIPILTQSSLDPMFKDLNVLIIEDWESLLSPKKLNALYNKMKNNPCDTRKMYFPYWRGFVFSKIKSLTSDD